MAQIIEQLKSFTCGGCYDCSSDHDMDYCSSVDQYMCEECYRTVDFDTAIVSEEIRIEWKPLKKYIKKHATPKKVIKMFIVKIMRDEWENHDIDEILNGLMTDNLLFGN